MDSKERDELSIRRQEGPLGGDKNPDNTEEVRGEFGCLEKRKMERLRAKISRPCGGQGRRAKRRMLAENSFGKIGSCPEHKTRERLGKIKS